MNRANRQIISAYFKIKVYESDGQAYEDLFIKIMTESNANFQSVQAYGTIGDRKNDGYDKTTGSYYQVYAPKVLSNHIRTAIKKLNDDFKGLYNYWNDLYEVKNYYFVLNDKFKNGVEPKLNKAIAILEKEYPEINFNLLYNKNLEDIVLELSVEKIDNILGYIPDPENLELDAMSLNTVISYIIKLKRENYQSNIPKNPDQRKKIKFNSLSNETADYIKFGSYLSSELKEYFKRNSDIKETIREFFSNLYKEGKEKYTKSDDIYFYILKKSSPKQDQYVVNAVVILMSMYFETCDIFEEPKEPKQLTLF